MTPNWFTLIQTDVQLASKLNAVIDANDTEELKTLLDDSSLDLGGIDDTAAAMYMETLKNLKEDNNNKHVTMESIRQALKGNSS